MMLIIALAAAAAAPGPYEQYQIESETVCVGPSDKALAAPDTWTADGFRFTVKGASAEVHAEVKAKGDEARIGILAAVKDFSPETQANLTAFVAAFRKAGVSAIVVDGDSAYGVDDQDTTLTEMFSFLGGQGLPIYGIIGNSESRSSFNRALLTAYRKHPNVLNLDLVRRIDGDGFTLVSLPGYFDKRFIHESAGCQYKPEDTQALAGMVKGAKTPVVLVSHGPPRQEGRTALDVTEDGHNVGDPDLAVAIAEAHIPFGIFGHILESGGRATDLTGTKSVKPGQAVQALYVNPGPAFADPWSLNSGAISHGMAAILSIKNGKGEWQQVKASASASGGRPKGRTSRPRAR
jgi:Icc-related predicted phosphoesterase